MHVWIVLYIVSFNIKQSLCFFYFLYLLLVVKLFIVCVYMSFFFGGLDLIFFSFTIFSQSSLYLWQERK